MSRLAVAPRTNIGRMARLRLKAGQLGAGADVYGNVIDLVAGSPMPKRIRIQHGYLERHGDVVMPGEYIFLWWADEEEDP